MPDRIESSDAGPRFEGLSFLTVKSDALRGRGDITVFVSPDTRDLRDVPLIVLLHGAYGSHWNWSVSGSAHLTAQRLISQKILPPCVLAMPSDGLWGDGSGYLPHTEKNFERWIVDDVIAAVRASAACVSEKSPVFLGGLSMGGFGALRIGAKYPEKFRGLSGHSSITHFDQLMKYVREDAASFGTPAEERSVLDAMLRNRDKLPKFRFDCGASDVLARFNRQLHEDLDRHGIAHVYEEFPGGHDWGYWTTHVEDSLRFFGEILKKPV